MVECSVPGVEIAHASGTGGACDVGVGYVDALVFARHVHPHCLPGCKDAAALEAWPGGVWCWWKGVDSYRFESLRLELVKGVKVQGCSLGQTHSHCGFADSGFEASARSIGQLCYLVLENNW